VVFFDTNIFVYAVSMAEDDQEKRRIARAMLADEDFALLRVTSSCAPVGLAARRASG